MRADRAASSCGRFDAAAAADVDDDEDDEDEDDDDDDDDEDDDDEDDDDEDDDDEDAAMPAVRPSAAATGEPPTASCTSAPAPWRPRFGGGHFAGARRSAEGRRKQ